jgi:hypothetical protein
MEERHLDPLFCWLARLGFVDQFNPGYKCVRQQPLKSSLGLLAKAIPQL